MNVIAGNLIVEVASTERQADALRLVFHHLSEADLAAVVGGLLAGAKHDPLPLSGLYVARRGETLVGAVWAQSQPGATAVVWPPHLIAGEPDSTATVLLDVAMTLMRQRRVALAQSLLLNEFDPGAARLKAVGFKHLAKLFYLAATQTNFPSAAPNLKLTFEPYREENHVRLASAVVKTYEATRDCPALDGQRRIDDVLAGYRATGIFNPDCWLLVRYRDEDIGCLLLADHPGADQYELVYMGLIPAARGRCFGREVVKQAQWLTELAGRPRLVLAVDANNRPALEMYRSCGFVMWNERTVYIRSFDRG
jgi:ribosomal protein S18 acetylase RimI-like enzyme